MTSFYEAEFEDKYIATIPFIDDVSVLIMHRVAHINLRRNFINQIRPIFPDIQKIEFYLEDEMIKEDETFVQDIIKEMNEKILFLDFDSY